MHTATTWFHWLSLWQDLTAEEGAAIALEDWNRVAQAQQRKDQLQNKIEACLESQPQGPEWRGEWQQVIQAERRNAELLENIYQRRREEGRVLDASRQNLKSVRRSYAGTPALAGWQSYG